MKNECIEKKQEIGLLKNKQEGLAVASIARDDVVV